MRNRFVKWLLIHICAFLAFSVFLFKFPEEVVELKYWIYSAIAGEKVEPVIGQTEATESIEMETYLEEEPIKSISERLAAFAECPPMEHTGKEWYNNTRLIYHAGGGIDGLTYSNAKEAMEMCMKQGHYVIEMDFSFTSDNHLVCVHEWQDIGDLWSPCTLDEYLNLKIYGRYTPLTAEDIIQYMEENPDLHIVIDTKGDNVAVVAELVRLADNQYDVINRFIIQLYYDGQKQKMNEIYPFPDENFLFTLYKFNPGRYEEIMKICYDEDIRVITVGIKAWSQEVVDEFLKKGFIVFEHTPNRMDWAQESMDKGIQGIYTDFLTTEDMEKILNKE